MQSTYSKATNDLYVQTTDDSQCLGWSNNQLTYMGKECQQIPSIVCQVYGAHAIRVDLSYNRLTTLAGVEKFSAVEELILDNNCLDDNTQFPHNLRLRTLSLNKNNFQTLSTLISRLRVAYPNLKYLSLLGNGACPDQLSNCEKDEDDYRRYRYLVIYKLPCLSFLDSRKIKISERKEALRVGEFMQVVRPDEKALYQLSRQESGSDALQSDAQIVSSPSSQGSHSGAYGKLKYKYSGKHSEGNRFIRNEEL